jgi:hypothetical protein
MPVHPTVPSRAPAGITLALLLVLALVFATPRPAPASAQEEETCGPDQPIACLDVPEQTEGGTGMGGAAPSAAAPAPPRPCLSIVVPERPAAAAAAPIPVPPGCSARDVFAAVNRANVLYRQALLQLDGSVLRSAWGGEALADLLGQIAVLRANDRYGDPTLLAISLVELRVTPSRAHVRTHENWIYRERDRFTGAVVMEQNQWVQNIYEMQPRGGSWVVMRDIITFISPPPPPPPSPPPPAPHASARVSIDRDFSTVGETVWATITNDGIVTLSGPGGQYPCGPLIVERLRDDGTWEPLPAQTFVACTLIAQLFFPGMSYNYAIPAGQAGVFRLVFKYSIEGGGSGVAYSPIYVVR